MPNESLDGAWPVSFRSATICCLLTCLQFRIDVHARFATVLVSQYPLCNSARVVLRLLKLLGAAGSGRWREQDQVHH